MTEGHEPVTGRPAGFVSRLLADAIDVSIVCVAAALVVLVVSMLQAVLGRPSDLRPAAWNDVERFALVPALFIAYLSVSWSASGRTAGKHVAGLRVITQRRSRVTAGRAFLRAIVCTAFPLGLLWVLVSRRRLAVHDLLVGTCVIYDWHPGRRTQGDGAPAFSREWVRAIDESSRADDADEPSAPDDDVPEPLVGSSAPSGSATSSAIGREDE